jgi:hypothetical protein
MSDLKVPLLHYLASAYDHHEATVKDQRYRDVLSLTIQMIDKGYHIFSPIVHNHFVAEALQTREKGAFEFWKSYDTNILRRCDVLLIYCDTEGNWRKSVGINGEHAFALVKQIKIMYVVRSDAGGGFEIRNHEPK